MIACASDASTILFNGLAEPLPSLRFTHLAGTQVITVSGQIDARRVIKKAVFVSGCSISDADHYGLHTLRSDLDAGENELISRI